MSDRTHETVYLAARYSRHAELEGYARTLRALGFTVSSRWHGGGHGFDEQAGMTDEQAQRFAEEDYEDLSAASILVAFTDGPNATGRWRGARHVEFGIALAQGSRLLLVGPRENVFHWLPVVWRFDKWEAARYMFEEMAVAARLRGLGE